MTRMIFEEAIDLAIADAMAADERVLLLGLDVPMLRAGLYARFGARRVLAAPISEGAYLTAAVGAAMAGLRPVVEIMMVDFITVALDALLNHAAKLEAFTHGRWRCPLVVRSACGAGYGDGGQHGQALWGLLASIPGLGVVVPSTPDDAYGLTASALAHDGPVVVLEHKLLTKNWLEFVGSGGRPGLSFDVPAAGHEGEVRRAPVPLGRAACRRAGDDVTLVSLGVSVHRALAAAALLGAEGISCEVLDLRSVRPLDVDAVVASARRTGRVLVVDEDYRQFGLSGEIAALIAEHGVSARFARVCTDDTIPFARHLEEAALPSVGRIVMAVRRLLAERARATRSASAPCAVETAP
ncbi:MAG: pyruvate dehydrogenase [Deltaproteobacteria bacterium]|nr:pyruvate dehydrogenase [Deltaproteobacteria bacterium]